MNCQACGHEDWNHSAEDTGGKYFLCHLCKVAEKGGPCWPWEFR